MTHSAVVGGSTAARVLACPPSRLIPKPPEAPNRYAQEGSALHTIIEMALKGDDDRAPEDFVGVTVDDVVIVSEMLDEKVKPAMAAFNQYVIDNHLVDLNYEEAVSIYTIPGAFGTADVMALSQNGEHLHIVDWKFGSGNQVQAQDNAQLLFYAAGALLALPTVCEKVTRVHLVVIQPNDRGLDTLREWVVDRNEVMDFATRLRWAVNHPDVPRASGTHCRYCPGQVTCPKLREDGHKLAVWANPHPEVTPQQVADMLDMAETTEMQIGALRAHAHLMAEQGQPPTGWKLVPRRALRKWVDQERVYKQLISDNPTVSINVLYGTPELLSPAQLEKKKLVIADGLTVSQSSGTTLARVRDPRPEQIAHEPLKRLAATVKSKL